LVRRKKHLPKAVLQSLLQLLARVVPAVSIHPLLDGKVTIERGQAVAKALLPVHQEEPIIGCHATQIRGGFELLHGGVAHVKDGRGQQNIVDVSG
jgi:hypothetical protein